MDGVQLGFSESALEEIAGIAVDRKTGARGLRSIMEKVLEDVMYEAPSDHTIDSIEITQDSVKRLAPPVIIRDPNKKPKPPRLTASSDKKRNKPA
jgi:ATP-dependent Clp protease ATP-binding subunit ClpX